MYSYPGVPWRTAEAIVVCRQLGYATTGAKVYYDNRYGFGSGQIWLAGVQCSGYETQLQLCQYQPNGYYQFSNYYTASMSCQGKEESLQIYTCKCLKFIKPFFTTQKLAMNV